MPKLVAALEFPAGSTQSVAGMIGSNNLNEVTNATSARGSIGLGQGTVFPSDTLAAGQRFMRTDLDYQDFVYDGTRWISVNSVILPFSYYPSGGGINDLSSGTYEQWLVALPSNLAFRVYRAVFVWFNFGTNNGSNYWKFVIRTFPGLTNLQTTPLNTSGGSAGSWSRAESTTWDSQPTTSDLGLEIVPTAQGTPGSIRLTEATLIGRWVAT